MSFKLSSFLITVLPLIFLLKFSDYYISSFLILKIINCMCEMSHWMSFEVDRYSSAWAHIALCADLTWATEPPDEFIIANQRLWAQHCRVSQVLQDTSLESQSLQSNNQCELTERNVIQVRMKEQTCEGITDRVAKTRTSRNAGCCLRWSTGSAS